VVNEASSSILNTLQKVNGRGRETGKKRVAIVKSRENERSHKFGSCVSSQIFPDESNATELVVAGLTCCPDENCHLKGIV
jgi:hypothetical protein